MVSHPSGTVTFLFTDVEGSTQLWAEDEPAMSASLRVHDSELRSAIEELGGYVFTTAGDSFAAAFARASDAVDAATEAQRRLAAVEWPGPVLRIRMGLHLGEAEERDGDYFGSVVSTAARVEAAGHGGQILVTEPVRITAGIDGRELGTYRLRDVAEPMALFQVGDGDFPPLRADDPWKSNLPARPTRLLGRETDVVKVRRLLATERLVTLTAVGGSGKTRLALAVGEVELAHRSGGVWFVDLTAVASDPEVPEAVAGALGLTLRVGDQTAQIIEYLADQAALVILDNCEHVIDAVADLAEQFLATPGRSALLATSREMLDVEGERLYGVGSLPTEGAMSPGVMLFCDRATAVDPEFTIDDSNEAALSALCARLDGMPLAIELAAIQVSVMTPAELLAGLDDRFQLLSGGRRRARQRTLEATLDWSYDLLEPDLRRVFRSLGVFVDGFDLDAAGAVTGSSRVQITAAVQSLVAKSLLIRLDRGETSRFGMLETVKAYAEDRLIDAGEAAEVRRLHFDHFHDAAAVTGLVPLGETRVGYRLRHDMSNLTAAFETAVAADDWARATALLNGAFPAYELFGRVNEGLGLLVRAVEHWTPIDQEPADHLLAQSLSALVTVDDFAQAQQHAIRISDSSVPYLRAIGLVFHGWAVSYSQPGRSKELVARAQEELDEARRVVPSRNTEIAAIYLLLLRAGHLCVDREYEAALRDGREATKIHRRLDYWAAAGMLPGGMEAMCLALLGQPEKALAIDSVEEEEILAALHVAGGDFNRVFAIVESGDLDEGTRRVRKIAVRGLTRRYAYEANDCVVLLAALAFAEGEFEIATELVLQAGTGSGWSVIVADHVAGRLEVLDERKRRIVESIRSRDTAHNTEQAAAALRTELDRRGWQEPVVAS